MSKPNTPKAMERVRKALDHIQAAQGQLDRACAELSTLVGGIPAWRRVSKLYDSVHAEWYKVKGFADQDRGLFVDSEPKP